MVRTAARPHCCAVWDCREADDDLVGLRAKPAAFLRVLVALGTPTRRGPLVRSQYRPSPRLPPGPGGASLDLTAARAPRVGVVAALVALAIELRPLEVS
jgi:hypothetical protein